MPTQTEPSHDNVEEAAEAARKAGWNPADGNPPYDHALEPDDAAVTETEVK